MSQQNNPPEPDQTFQPELIPPGLSEEERREIENRARHEISLIEHQARLQARHQYPLEPLPRAVSNIRSVKRSRFIRKEVSRVLAAKIHEKTRRNRELDRLIEIEKQISLEFKKRQEEDHRKLSQFQPQLELRLDRIEHETPQRVMQEFIAKMDSEHAHTPNTIVQSLEPPESDPDFDAQYSNLRHTLLDFQPFADTSHGENDNLSRCLLDPLVDSAEALECDFFVDQHGIYAEQPGNQHLESQDAQNQELDNEEPENLIHQDGF